MKKTFATILIALTSALIACGSESAEQLQQSTPPSIEQPPTPPGQNDKPDQKIVPSVVDPDLDAGVGEQDGGDTSDGGTTDPTDGGTTDPTDSGTDPTDGGTGGETDGGVVTPPPPPTSATVGGVQIDFVSQDGSTFCYQVTELDGAKDLSHWDLGTNCTVVSGTESILVPTVVDDVETLVNVIESFKSGTDPKSGITGGKWNVSSLFSTGLFCITVDGLPTLSTGEVQVASKSGKPISYGTIAGPVCQ